MPSDHSAMEEEMAKAKFPKQIYVKREFDERGGESWLAAQETTDGIVDSGETTVIAIYELVRTVTASAPVQIK